MIFKLDVLVKLPFRDLRPLVTSYVTGLWRSDWENDSTNKLQRIGAIVDSLRPMMNSRREETVLTRLRIGHPRAKIRLRVDRVQLRASVLP